MRPIKKKTLLGGSRLGHSSNSTARRQTCAREAAKLTRIPHRRHNKQQNGLLLDHPRRRGPLVAKPQGKSLKALVAAGAAVASFALGAVAATAVSASVAAPTTAFFKPMYVFNKSLGTKTFGECKKECPKLDGKGNKGQMSIPCITSFDMNHQLLAWMTEKYGPVDTFAWATRTREQQEFQDEQYKGDFVKRNGCAFSGDLSKSARQRLRRRQGLRRPRSRFLEEFARR